MAKGIKNRTLSKRQATIGAVIIKTIMNAAPEAVSNTSLRAAVLQETDNFVEESEVKRIINFMRSYGHAQFVIGTAKGYKYCTDIVALEDYEQRLRVQAARLTKTAEIVAGWRKAVQTGQNTLQFDEAEVKNKQYKFQ